MSSKNDHEPIREPRTQEYADWSAFLRRHGFSVTPNRGVRATTLPWINVLAAWVAPMDRVRSKDEIKTRDKLVRTAIRTAKRDPNLLAAIDTCWRLGGDAAALGALITEYDYSNAGPPAST